MKAKHVFLTMGLALVMGAGIAASGVISMAKGMQPARAATKTIYCKMEHSWWKADGAAVGIYAWYGTGEGATPKKAWPGERMAPVTGETDMWQFDIDIATYPNVIFTRVNGGSGAVSDWGAKTKNLTFPTDSKNFFTITNSSATWGDPGCDGTWGIYPIPTGVDVDVHVNGKSRGVENIPEGTLPAGPTLGYAKSWDGKWYTDEDCTEECTGVTSDVYDLYCEVVDHAYLQFTLDASRATDKFAETYLYTWDDGGIEKAWPGTKFTGDTFYVADDAKFIINAGDKKEQTVNIDVSPVEEDTLRILNTTDGAGHYETIWESEVDEPAEEGYYIKNNRAPNAWKYAGADKMQNTTGDNVAHLMNFEAQVNDEIRVCSYYTDRSPFEQWATLGDNGYSGYGEQSGDNFKFTKAGHYDIYAKYEDRDENPEDRESFMFYVAEHVNSYEISMTAVMFEGPTKLGTAAQDSQLAYSGSNFNPVQPDMSGYAKRGYFTDADCTIAYVAHEFSAAGQLYAKYTKVGYYMISESTSWSIDAAVSMSTTDLAPTDKAQITLTVAAANEKHSFVYYNASGAMEGHNGLGASYAFASTDEDNNIVFSEPNTYYIYWSNGDGKIYIETVSPDMKKALAFVRDFKDSMAEACSAETQEASVKAAWAEAATAYKTMKTSEAAAAALVEQGGYSSDAEIRDFAERYIYIYQHHASWNLENFMGWEISASTNYINGLVINNNVLLITIISVSTLAVSAGLILFLLKRKRLVK